MNTLASSKFYSVLRILTTFQKQNFNRLLIGNDSVQRTMSSNTGTSYCNCFSDTNKATTAASCGSASSSSSFNVTVSSDDQNIPTKLTTMLSASNSDINCSNNCSSGAGGSGSSINYRKHSQHDAYSEAIRDLNSLQSNSLVVALAKYKKPEKILPLFRKQLHLAGISVEDLNKLNIIHVSGTKGKGSTCALIENILASSDKIRLKVGCYNSPHLVNVTERIRINSKPIDKVLFSKHFRHVYDKLKYETKRENITMPSYFSFLTILAFHIFLEESIDCAIVEVGIGGEYDPTNVIEKPLACAITTLDLDHTNILGKTIESIAWTKAGIMKPGVPMFTIEHEQEEVIRTIEKRAREKRAPLYICKSFDHHSNINLGIKSHAQYVNASIACQVAAYLLARVVQDRCKVANLLERSFADNADQQQQPVLLETNLQNLPDFFRTSLAHSKMDGRCQIVKCSGVTFFLDGAHTRKSMENCLDWFARLSMNCASSNTKRFLLINVIGDRDKSEVLKPLIKFCHFDGVMFSTNKIHSNKDEATGSETFLRMQEQNNEKSLENAKINARVWSDLIQQQEDTSIRPDATIHSSTMDCLMSLESYKTTNESNDMKSTGEMHVLVTGSLHFVGAILESIELLYPNALQQASNMASRNSNH